MKHFKLAPLALALAGAFTVVPVAQSEVPSGGDIDIYSSSTKDKSPTLMLVLEASTYMNYADSIKQNDWDVEIIDIAKDSSKEPFGYATNPIYKRYHYFNSISGTNFPTRLTRMKDAIFYLMDTEGKLPDNYRIGLSRYSGGVTTLDDPGANGDSNTANITIAAKQLGPVPIDKGKYIVRYKQNEQGEYLDASGAVIPKDSDKKVKEYGKYKTTADGDILKVNGEEQIEYVTTQPPQNLWAVSHRWKIKDYVARMCDNDRFCTGEAPMAAAYAETGAYLMGTKTSQLTYKPKTPPVDADNKPLSVIPKTRVLRHKGDGASGNKGTWEFCPEDKRQMVFYDTKEEAADRDVTYEYIRTECAEDDWVPVDRSTVPDQAWAGTDANEPSKNELERIEGKRQYNLMWYYLGGSNDRPHGTFSDGPNTRISPKTLTAQKYGYKNDELDKFAPTEDNPGGVKDEWTYMVDVTEKNPSSLVPVLRKRVLRRQFDWSAFKDKWQYCDFTDAQLVNYIYSSYRFQCPESKWVDIGASNIASVTGNMTWNGSWWFGGRPHEVDTRYLYDPLANPYDGWAYYYDNSYTSTQYPPLPPTLNTGFASSGIRNSTPDVRSDQSYKYQHPEYSECSGIVQTDSTGAVVQGPQTVENGIMFLTAGWPRSPIVQPRNEMNMSLTPFTSNEPQAVGGNMTEADCEASGLPGGILPINNHWGCIGAYSKRLNSKQNPLGIPIKTGVFMFTAVNEKLPVKGVVDGVTTYDCSAAETESQANACKLGQYGEGYGEGGFFQSNSSDPAQSYKELADAIVKMAENLNDDLGMVPTGVPAIPQDSFNVDAVLDYGYMPLMAPRASSNVAQWPGNLRKFKQVNGSYVDQNNDSPFSAAQNALLSATSKDYWASDVYKSSEQAGGAFENIPQPASATTVTPRKVYLSEATSGTTLTKLSPAKDSITQVSIDGIDNSSLLQRLLLNYMGYGITQAQYDEKGLTTDSIITKFDEANKTLGGVFHSTPIALTSKLSLDGNNYKVDNQYILFGAMDNAVHVVDNASGEEVMSFFPREVLATNGQYKAITSEVSADKEAGELAPAFGVDAPWASYATYGPIAGNGGKPDYSTLEAKKLYAFGGARLGGKAYYGLDLTDIHENTFKPKQLFTITPTSHSQFSRLGYTWAKPVITKINWKGERKLVAILTGGYDTHYDMNDQTRADLFAKDATAKNDYQTKGTKGNAIYVVDAETGEPLIVASNDPTTDTDVVTVDNDHMKYSIVGSVKTLDRDADELTDHIYYADLNGQVFRLDINNAASKAADPNVSGSVATKPAAYVTRLATLKLKSTDDFGARFYETPIVTVHENADGERFVAVSLASGDRSNPLFEPSTDVAPNYVYTLYDKDVGKVNLFGGTMTTKDIAESNLTTIFKRESGAVSGGATNYSQKGWKSPLNVFSVYDDATKGFVTSNSNAVKALGAMSAISSKLYIPIYNPKDGLGDDTGCTAEVKGSSEAMQFCLPYGYCDNTSTSSDQAQRVKIGKGIQGIVFGGSGDNNQDRRLITTNPSSKEQDADGNVVVTPGSADGLNSDANAPDFKDTHRFSPILRPMVWFDLQSQEEGTATQSKPTTGTGNGGTSP